jgi:hypothetical protein
MKAIKDEKIICGCGTEVGYLFNSVESNARLGPGGDSINTGSSYRCAQRMHGYSRILPI